MNTAHGAERYIRRKKPIYLDSKCTTPLPIPIDIENLIVHKIIVAHGAKEACEQASDQNVYGSLAVTYCETEGGQTPPFFIEVDKHAPIHILDSHNLSIILSELDTVTDLSRYLDTKIRAVEKFDSLVYCGEEDLLGHYLLNFDSEKNEHVIGTDDEDINEIYTGEGEWHDFINTDIYKNTKNEDRASYFWDELIQRTCQNALDGVLGGNSDIMRGKSAIFDMVKEPRFMRRALAKRMMQAVANFPDHPTQLTRHVAFMPSFIADVGYVFFQLRVPESMKQEPDYREKRITLLEIACGAAKNKFPNLKKVIGIGIDAPKFSGETNSEDFILLPCEEWTDEVREHDEELNQEWNFFGTSALEQSNEHITQFVPPEEAGVKPVENGW
ncbi:MAG: hypothetical protein KZQ89_08490 [Candidatus Thiodiazotropha sp. (ex Lucinoma kastoroae)]|nr:hypothetical protein [Candidatus Thiodiazotropha sp. (ex Lucinoma kastoroae)]